MSTGSKEIKEDERQINNHISCIKEFWNLQKERDSLVDQREILRTDITSMDNQMLGIKNQKMLVDESTKGLTLPVEIFIEKKKELDKLRNWQVRITKAKEYKIREITKIRKQLRNLQKQIEIRAREVKEAIKE